MTRLFGVILVVCFASMAAWAGPIAIFSSGVNGSGAALTTQGAPDPHWSVVNTPGYNGAAIVVDPATNGYSGWVADVTSGPAGSQANWITAPGLLSEDGFGFAPDTAPNLYPNGGTAYYNGINDPSVNYGVPTSATGGYSSWAQSCGVTGASPNDPTNGEGTGSSPCSLTATDWTYPTGPAWDYETSFSVDSSNVSLASITGDFATDDSVLIAVNAGTANEKLIGYFDGTNNGVWFGGYTSYSIGAGLGTFVQGVNTLDFIVYNGDGLDTAPSASGLLIADTLTVGIDPAQGNDQPIPEPASLMLLGTGLLGMGRLIRRKTAVR